MTRGPGPHRAQTSLSMQYHASEQEVLTSIFLAYYLFFDLIYAKTLSPARVAVGGAPYLSS